VLARRQILAFHLGPRLREPDQRLELPGGDLRARTGAGEENMGLIIIKN
jgi:hypothetical protein